MYILCFVFRDRLACSTACLDVAGCDVVAYDPLKGICRTGTLKVLKTAEPREHQEHYFAMSKMPIPDRGEGVCVTI